MWIAIEYSYKLGQKNEIQFLCELGWFLQRLSQMTLTVKREIQSLNIELVPVPANMTHFSQQFES